jgi:hypothetical protein
MIIPEENMPYTKDGIRPDIIINPHAIPSRMTIGHLVECIFAKLCCIDGVLGDASVFIPLEKETIYKGLKNNNFNKYGNEILYNGFNGTQINTEIFIGPTFYFRLKHMVAEKINSRGVGKVVGLTRQPTEGRRKGGGLRIGEMERDTVLSHGISNFIKESMMERSDKFCWCICKRCGTLVSHNIKENINICRGCNNDDVTLIQTPYSFKLFIQELETMGIQPRLNTEFIDMPIDQLEFTRSYNAGNNDDDSVDGEDATHDADSDDSDDINYKDIDYNFFNSQIDNFATKNTMMDEKIWKDTYHKKFDKIIGGNDARNSEDEEDLSEDNEDNEDVSSDNEDLSEDNEEVSEDNDDVDDSEDDNAEDIKKYPDNKINEDKDDDVVYEEDTNDEIEEYEDDKIEGGDLIKNTEEVKKDDSGTIKEIIINM